MLILRLQVQVALWSVVQNIRGGNGNENDDDVDTTRLANTCRPSDWSSDSRLTYILSQFVDLF